MGAAILSSGWQAFERLQHFHGNNEFAQADALADDEALTDLLDDFRFGQPSTEEVDRRYNSLRRNRRRKHHTRGRLFAKHTAESATTVTDPSHTAEQDDLIKSVVLKLMPEEWAILRRLAAGDSYSKLATELDVSTGTVRTRVCRTRELARTAA